MPIPFIMPKFDMDQEKATILAWAKHEGDFVQRDEIVLSVETDKVAIDVPSPATGTLARISYQAGDVVPVTTVIAHILKEGETLADLPEPAPSTQAPVPGPAVQMAMTAQAAPVTVSATPVAAGMARAAGVDLSKVPAPSGRVTREDVERYLATLKPAARVAVAATPAARRLARESSVALETVTGTGPQGRVQAADVRAASSAPNSPSGGERRAEVVELTGVRRTIAERMQESFHDLPHIALTIEVDVTAFEACRVHLNQVAEKRSEAKVSLTALLVKAVAWALERHPYLNASLIEGKIHLWKDVNVGVATAVESGLVVPVVHGANHQSVRQLADALQDLTARARQRKLNLHDVQQGTFTISNLGMYGITQFRAIINPPESAILAVGRVVRKPVVINQNDDVAVRPILSLTLSADHRVIDGVAAAQFLQELAQAIERPDTLLY